MSAQPPPQYSPYAPHPPQPATPEPKRSWFARHKVLTAGLAFGGLLFFGILAASGDDETSTAPETTTSPSEPSDVADETSVSQDTGDEATDVQEAAAESADEDEDAPEAEEAGEADADPDQPGIGDVVSSADFEFTVTEVETGVQRIGSEYLSTDARGQFILVRATVTNTGSQEQTFWADDQRLMDTEGRTHSSDTEASFYLDETDSWLTDVNPGVTADVVLVFDIPDDAVPAEVQLQGSMFSTGAAVSVN